MSSETDFITLNVERPDDALFKRSEDYLEAARIWKVVTPEQATMAGDDLKGVKTLAKELEKKRTKITKPLNVALREVNALFKPAKDWLKEAEGLLKGKLLKFQNEQDRIARELQAEADAKARKEREELELKARLATAVDRPEKAKKLHEEAEAQIAPVVESAAPKIEGVVRRETWKADVTDKLTLIKYIANERNDLLGMVKIDQSVLNGHARLLKEELGLPGVEVRKESSIAARGG